MILFYLRYEISVGLTDQDEPVGIFDVANERHWFDVGQSLEATITFNKGSFYHYYVAKTLCNY